MTDIPMTSRAKRPAFFKDGATDQMMTMLLEMMSELWVVKERVYTLEKVLSNHGLNVSEEIETCELSTEEGTGLEEERQRFVSTILRSLEAEFVTPSNLNAKIDELTDQMKSRADN